MDAEKLRQKFKLSVHPKLDKKYNRPIQFNIPRVQFEVLYLEIMDSRCQVGEGLHGRLHKNNESLNNS